jgi:hypothetical protein
VAVVEWARPVSQGAPSSASAALVAGPASIGVEGRF